MRRYVHPPVSLVLLLVAPAFPVAVAAQHAHKEFPPEASAYLTIADDPEKGELTLRLGPLHLPARSTHHEVEQIPMQVGTVAFAGWLHGFRTEVVTAGGRQVSRRVIHHVNLLDLDRRAVLLPIPQRIAAAGTETAPLEMPRTHGYPLKEGHTLGLFTGFHNPTDEDYDEAYLEVHLSYTRAPAENPPREVHTIWFDAHFSPGDPTAFDLPVGSSEHWQEFTPEISGKILALGGHLHDYGMRLTLEDRTTGKLLYAVEPIADSTGHVTRMSTRLYLQEGGLDLIKGHVYRITAYYDNPTGKVIPEGGMGQIGGIFVPSSGEQWPELDKAHPVYARDMRALLSGHGRMDQKHQH